MRVVKHKRKRFDVAARRVLDQLEIVLAKLREEVVTPDSMVTVQSVVVLQAMLEKRFPRAKRRTQ